MNGNGGILDEKCCIWESQKQCRIAARDLAQKRSLEHSWCVCHQVRNVTAGDGDIHEWHAEAKAYKNCPSIPKFLFELQKLLLRWD